MPILGFLIIAVHAGAMVSLDALAQETKPNPSMSAPREVTAAILRHWPPQYDVDENGNPVGFAIDILEEIAKRAGGRFIQGTARWSQEFAPMPVSESSGWDIPPIRRSSYSPRHNLNVRTFAGPILLGGTRQTWRSKFVENSRPQV